MKETIITLENGEKLKMAAPTVRVLKNASLKSNNEMEQSIFIIASLINKQESEVEELELKDFMKLQGALKGFLEEAGLTA